MSWPPTQEDTEVQPFRVTPGFIAFLTAVFAPVILGLIIVAGATLVADEVYAAEAQEQSFGEPSSEADVADWKKTLVGICPLH